MSTQSLETRSTAAPWHALAATMMYLCEAVLLELFLLFGEYASSWRFAKSHSNALHGRALAVPNGLAHKLSSKLPISLLAKPRPPPIHPSLCGMPLWFLLPLRLSLPNEEKLIFLAPFCAHRHDVAVSLSLLSFLFRCFSPDMVAFLSESVVVLSMRITV